MRARARARRPAPEAVVTREPAGPIRNAWPAFAAIALTWAVLFAPQLFQRQVFTLGDTRVFRPFAEFSRERWLSLHQRTYWNPYVFGGISASASLADPRPQYLPDVALDAFERMRPSNVVPLGGPLLAHLAGMLAMAALARALWGSGAAGMAVAGLVWGLLPELLVPFIYGHDAQLVTCSLLPVVLLAIHHACAATTRCALGATLALAAVAGIMVLNGHPQIEVLGAMLALPFAIERALHHRRPWRLAWIGGAGLLAVAIGAAVWLPALHYSEESLRGGGGAVGVSMDEVRRFSFGPSDMLSLAWPRAVGFSGDTYWGGLIGTDYGRFLGVVTLLLAGSALVRGRRESMVWVLFVFAVFAALCSLGTSIGAVGIALRAVVPMSSQFRVSTVWIGIAQLALVLLAARALVGPPEAQVRPPRSTWVVAAILLLAGVALAGPLRGVYAKQVLRARPACKPATAERAAREAGSDLALRAIVLAAAAALLWRARAQGPRSAAAAGLAALAALDLGSVSWPMLHKATGPLERVLARPMPELARIGAREPWARVSSTRELPTAADRTMTSRREYEFYSNDWIRWRARTLGGDHGAPPALWRSMGNITRSYGAMCAFGVTYMSADPGAPWSERQFETVFRGPSEIVYRLRGALGRAYAVPEVVAPGNDILVIRSMMLPGFDPGRVALASEPGVAGEYPGSPGCRIGWIADDPDRVSIVTEAPDRAFVVLADAWFPGWSARVDGAEVPVHRVDQLVRGVIVEAGRHRVDMTYEPRGWGVGVGLTRLGLLAAAALALAWGAWEWRARRRAIRIPI